MASSTTFPQNEPHEATKLRLLEAAGKVFSERGFEAATVREICREAACNVAAINYHFGDKERLYIETVKSAHRQRVEEVPLPTWDASTLPEAKLHGFVLTLLTRMIKDPDSSWHAKLMMRELLRPTAACAELVRDFFRPHFQALLGILSELLPPDVSEAKRHLIAFSVVGQCLHYRVARPIVELLVGPDEAAGMTPAFLADHIASFTLAALRQLAAEAGEDAS